MARFNVLHKNFRHLKNVSGYIGYGDRVQITDTQGRHNGMGHLTFHLHEVEPADQDTKVLMVTKLLEQATKGADSGKS